MKKIITSAVLTLFIIADCAFASDDIKPGLWNISLESGVAASPDWKPQPFVTSQCLTEADAQNPDRLLLGMGSSGATGCEFLNRQYSGNTLTFEVNCAGTLGIKGHGQVTYSASTVDGFLDISTGGEIKVDMQNKIHATYLGDCPATGGGLP